MKTAWIVFCALPVLSSSAGHSQQTAAAPTNQANPSPAGAAAYSQTASPDASAPAAQDVLAGPVSEENDLRQALEGKQLFIRGRWLGDELHFNMSGDLVGQSAKGSFTLSAVQIEQVRLTKRRVELEGVRYGIHFDDTGNWAEQATSFDRIRVTPKKKHVEITINREQVIVPKKKKGEEEKEEKAAAGKNARGAPTTAATSTTGTEAAPGDASAPTTAAAAPAPATPTAGATGGSSGASGSASASKEEQEPTTQDPAKAAEQLRVAVNHIFAPALDAKMIADMPDYWQYFYQAQRNHRSMEPSDPAIVRPGPGVDGPKLMKNIVAPSNDYAQKSQVVGIASYKVILDPDGKPIAVAVYRPIGFGLDENAVTAIRKSTFAPAVKGGKAMSSVVDVDVLFRIYSKLTSTQPPAAQQAADAAGPNISPVTGKPSLPGLFSVQATAAAAQHP